MKKILSGTVAAIALIAVATPAAAQHTNQRHYAGTVLGIPYTATNPNGLETLGLEFGLGLGVGTRYRAQADAPNDSENATPTVNVVFSLSGTVNRDCSFYAGNDSSARNIDFGVIGVRTGNNENVNSAFEMVGQAEANIDTLTAGCNTNNVVEINKNDIVAPAVTNKGLVAGSYTGTTTLTLRAL